MGNQNPDPPVLPGPRFNVRRHKSSGTVPAKPAADPRDLPTMGDVSSLLLALCLLQHYRSLCQTQTPERRGVLSGGVLGGHLPQQWHPRVSCTQLSTRTLGNNHFIHPAKLLEGSRSFPSLHFYCTALAVPFGEGVHLQNAPPHPQKGLGAGLTRWLQP